jgi:hypothetical protein
LRHIGGFGAMGWIDAHELNPITPLDDAEETALLDALAHSLPQSISPLGIDRFGIDFEIDAQRIREKFDEPAIDSVALNTALSTVIPKIVGKSAAIR